MNSPREKKATILHNLENSRDGLFMRNENPKLLVALKSRFPQLQRAYVIDWIPEQGEDVFTLLVENELIAIVDIAKGSYNAAAVIRVVPLAEYLRTHRRMSKARRQKLDVAIEMMK